MKVLLPEMLRRINGGNQKGFSLLEYAVGAAVLAGIIVTAMNAFGNGLNAYFTSLGNWINGLSIGS